VINRIFFSLIILSLVSVYLNNLKTDSYQYQLALHNDLKNGTYNLNIDLIHGINHLYPSLSFNSIPISSLKARYYHNLGQSDQAYALLDQGIEYNPYMSYSFYLKSRILINDLNYNEAIEYLRNAYNLSPNINIVASLYFALLAELNYFDELYNHKSNVMSSNDIQIWVFYLKSLLTSVSPDNKDSVKEIFNQAKTIFPNNKSINDIYSDYLNL